MNHHAGAPEDDMTLVSGDAPLHLLLIDNDRSMARAHAELFRNHGIECDIAPGVESALAALGARVPNVVVLSLGLPDGGAGRVLDALDERGDNRPRVVGIKFAADGGVLPEGVDALVVKPTPPEALLRAAGVGSELPRRPTEADQLIAVVEMTSLGAGLDEGMTRLARQLCGAFDAFACCVFGARADQLWCHGVEGLDRRAMGRLAERARVAAGARATTLMEALVTRTPELRYERAFESYSAVSAIGDDRRTSATLCLVHPELVALSPGEWSLLGALVRRLATEWAWQAVHERLALELDAMRELGGLDPLLGIWSRSILGRLLSMMESACKRTNEPLCVAIVDVCDMAQINDRYGHSEGDALLRHVAEVAVYVVRGSDAVARYAGDDIAIVFPGAKPEDATRVVERLQSALASQPYQTDDGREVMLRTAAGISAISGSADSGEAALARAAVAASEAASAGLAIAHVSAREARTDRLAKDAERALEGVTLGGAYRLLHEIGSGGGGGVYRGEDLALRRPVAVKVLRQDFARDAEIVERFREEASILASLHHPSLVQVYTFGVDDGLAYFVMELVEGESLFDAIARCQREARRVPLPKVASIAKQIASALDTLHRSGIIHRDVKPANVLIDPFRGRAVLVDVGIATRPGEQTRLAGTPGYMAPEAVDGKSLDASADVYGLAVTLYELLTLQLPWPASEHVITMLRLQRERPATPPSTHRPELAPLDPVIFRALNNDPERRFPHVSAFAAALAAALDQVRADESADLAGLPLSAPDPSQEAMAIASAPTMSFSAEADSGRNNTRAVVFRCLARVLGPRNTAAWRLELSRNAQHLADALLPSGPPLAWLPTEWLIELLGAGPPGRSDPEQLGRDLGRAAVRATFRRFFPASAATLAPEGTIKALPQIWPHYHSWGAVHLTGVRSDHASIRVRGTPRKKPICAWTQGMLEQLLVLSGGDAVEIDHPQCEVNRDEACVFTCRWAWSAASDARWR
jgi:diguanylate cyclase (GGDEF)-like protein